MKFRFLSVLAIGLFLGLLVTFHWIGNVTYASARQNGPVATPARDLDSLAAAAQNNEENAVRSLSLAIFEPFAWANHSEIAGRVGSRISAAEMSYRSGRQIGITEDRVALAVNNLADRLGAPDYALSDLNQVRCLRLNLALTAPRFVMAHHRNEREMFFPEMSPAEATYVALSLIHQKLYNPRFQLNPKNWAEARYREDWATWSKHQKMEELPDQSGPVLVSIFSPRTDEIQGTVATALDLMGENELQELPGLFLDDLGVSR